MPSWIIITYTLQLLGENDKDDIFLKNPKNYRRDLRLSPIDTSYSKENARSWVLVD